MLVLLLLLVLVLLLLLPVLLLIVLVVLLLAVVVEPRAWIRDTCEKDVGLLVWRGSNSRGGAVSMHGRRARVSHSPRDGWARSSAGGGSGVHRRPAQSAGAAVLSQPPAPPLQRHPPPSTLQWKERWMQRRSPETESISSSSTLLIGLQYVASSKSPLKLCAVVFW